MFIGVFKRVQWYTPLLMFFLASLMWVEVFFDPSGYMDIFSDVNAPLYELMIPLFQRHPAGSMVFAFLFLCIQVVMVNHLASSRDITDRFSALPGLVYLVLMSSIPKMLSPHPVLFANFFLMIALHKSLTPFSENKFRLEIFNKGFLICLAALFYYPSGVFLLLLFFSLFVYYVVDIRTVFSVILGFVTPLIFLSTWFFLTDQLHEQWLHLQHLVGPFSLPTGLPSPLYQVFSLAMALLSIVSFFYLRLRSMRDQPIRVRKQVSILLLFFLAGLLSFLPPSDYTQVHFGILALPLSISLGVFFFDLKKKKLAEFIFGLLLILILTIRMAPLMHSLGG